MKLTSMRYRLDQSAASLDRLPELPLPAARRLPVHLRCSRLQRLEATFRRPVQYGKTSSPTPARSNSLSNEWRNSWYRPPPEIALMRPLPIGRLTDRGALP